MLYDRFLWTGLPRGVYAAWVQRVARSWGDDFLNQARIVQRVRLRCCVLVAVALQGFTGTTLSAQRSESRIGIVEELRLSGEDEEFSGIGAVRVGSRGDIAISQRRDGQVRIYEATGKRLATVGRRGSGPGEFRGPQVTGWRGDTVWIFDFELMRHTFVRRDGKLVRTVPLSATLTPAGIKSAGNRAPVRSTFTPHARRADGTMLGLAFAAPPQNSSSALAIVSAAPSGDVTVLRMVPTSDSSWERSLNPRTIVAFAPDGSRMASLAVNVMSRRGGTFTVTLYAGDGHVIFSRRAQYQGVVRSKASADSVLARRRGPDGERLGVVPAGRIPPIHVPVIGINIGRDGSIWITGRDGVDGRVVTQLDETGKAIASISLPSRARLVDATTSHLWVVVPDEDDVESVIRYRIGK